MGLPAAFDIGLRAPPGHRSHAGAGDAGWSRTLMSIERPPPKSAGGLVVTQPLLSKGRILLHVLSFWAVLAFFSSQPLLRPFVHAFFGGLGGNSGVFFYFRLFWLLQSLEDLAKHGQPEWLRYT